MSVQLFILPFYIRLFIFSMYHITNLNLFLPTGQYNQLSTQSEPPLPHIAFIVSKVKGFYDIC